MPSFRQSIAAWMLVGCAPAANMRPLTPMIPNDSTELGVAYTAVGPRPVGQDEWAHGGQVWGTYQPATYFDVSLIGAFADGVTAGLAVRWRALEFDRFATGLSAEIGAGWAALNLPLAVRVNDSIWLYSAPQYGTWGVDLTTVRLPLGVDVKVADELRIRGEAQVNYPDFDPYKRRVHLGMGLAFRL